MINLSIPRDEQELKPRITVIGVGGAGGNAVNNMIRSNLVGCEFIVCNTDAQALQLSTAPRKIQLGIGVTRGLGAGARPDVGRAAAEEALDDILESMQGSNMVFITAGMGGGTGTGAAPVIARIARESGILTVGVVTKPFHFEGVHRMRLAEAGIEELQKYVDTLIIIPNQNLFRIANERTTFADAFKMADEVLHSGVRGVTDLMVMPGLINLDFADIRTVMSEMGKAMMGTGEAEGERRAIDAAEAAISNPLLDDVSMKGARGVLINITGGLDMTLFEVDEAANRDPRGGRSRRQHHLRLDLRREAGRQDAHLGRRHRHRRRTRAGAGAAGARRAQRRRRARLARYRLRLHPADADAERGRPPPPRSGQAAPPHAEARAKPGEPAPAAGGGRKRGGARAAPLSRRGRSIRDRARPVPIAHPAVRSPQSRRRRRRAATPSRGQGRVPSLIERVTGVGRARRPPVAAAPRPHATASRSAGAPGPAAPRAARSRRAAGRPARKTTCSTSRHFCAARPTEPACHRSAGPIRFATSGGLDGDVRYRATSCAR